MNINEETAISVGKRQLEDELESQSVTFNSGMFVVTLNGKEVQEIYEDVIFLRDAVLCLLNPREAEKDWDMMLDPKEVPMLLKEMFERIGNNKGLIQKYFEPQN